MSDDVQPKNLKKHIAELEADLKSEAAERLTRALQPHQVAGAVEVLLRVRRKLDPDGVMVGVSRQALDEVLAFGAGEGGRLTVDALLDDRTALRRRVDVLEAALIEATAELIYLRQHGKDGAVWWANENKDVWRQKARDARSKAGASDV